MAILRQILFCAGMFGALKLCVFNNDSAGKNSKMPFKKVQNSTLFGEIQTSTMTFIAYLMGFRLISYPFKNPYRIPTGPRGFITVPIPIPNPYPWESPWESPYPRHPWQTASIQLLPERNSRQATMNWNWQRKSDGNGKEIGQNENENSRMEIAIHHSFPLTSNPLISAHLSYI